MTSAWLLPEHLADVLPIQARQVEHLRRQLLDTAQLYGYELVIPPMLEYLDALHADGAVSSKLKAFKVVDQMSGRTLALRSDTTPQVARIDAHLLNRQGITRLCYCGPVLLALPDEPSASREALQFGAELYGHAGLEADLEVLDLTLQCLQTLGVKDSVIDAADARIFAAILDIWQQQSGQNPAPADIELLAQALAHKDVSALAQCWPDAKNPLRQATHALLDLFAESDGSSTPIANLLQRAGRVLPQHDLIDQALAALNRWTRHVKQSHPQQRVTLDLAEMGSAGYYTGIRFACYAPGSNKSLLRGGRYDAIGAAFGRKRPAVGFSLDVRTLAEVFSSVQPQAAILAPWPTDADLQRKIKQLRDQGRTVVCAMPGLEPQLDDFTVHSQLQWQGGQWVEVVLPERSTP